MTRTPFKTGDESYAPDAPPQPAIIPLAQSSSHDASAMLGLVKYGTPAALELRDQSSRKPLPFEEPKLRAAILDRLRKGYPKHVVFRALGAATSRLASWETRARRGVEPYASFLHEVDVAIAEGACGLMDDIRAAGRGAPDQHGIWKNKWEASRYLLEVNDPQTFKTVDKSISAHVELEPKKMLDVRAMTDEQLAKIDDALEGAPVVDAEIVEEGED